MAEDILLEDEMSGKTYATDHYEEFVCGWGASVINITCTFPVNKVMFRQQLHGINTVASIKQLKREGLFYLYRGLLPPLLQKSTSMSIMFGMYHRYRQILKSRLPEAPLLIIQGSAAILAGCSEATLTPFERVQTLMQDKKYQGQFKNTFHVFREMRPYGAREYYRGLTPVLLRNGPSNALFFILRGRIKNQLPASETPMGNTAANFISGGVLGALISTIFFPVNVVKTQMQRKMGGEFVSFWKMFVILFNKRNRSWRAMFLGVHINFTRSMISWGLINASYEIIKDNFFCGGTNS